MSPSCAVCGKPVLPPHGGYDHLTSRWDCGNATCVPADQTVRARVLEVGGGVPVVQKLRRSYGLEPGRRGRLYPGGPVVVVDRVSEAAAYVHPVYDPPRIQEVGRPALDAAVSNLLDVLSQNPTPEEAYRAARAAGEAAGKYRAIKVTRGPAEPGISRTSLLYPAEPAPAPEGEE